MKYSGKEPDFKSEKYNIWNYKKKKKKSFIESNSRLEMMEKKISEFEDRRVENIQSRKWKEKMVDNDGDTVTCGGTIWTILT